MAIEYTRIGWEDAPSRNTPIDAANLNHMDNGILALSMAYDTDIPTLQEYVQMLVAGFPTIQSVLGNFAQYESSETSAHAYAAGKHLFFNGYLYRVIAPIAIGDTIIPDTNCVQTTVGEEFERRTLWFKNKTLSVADGVILDYEHEGITPDHILSGSIYFSDNSKIARLDDWSTETPGHFILTGKCTGTCTATFTLELADERDESI